MKLDFNLQVTQKQGIALTAQVQQAIKLLHMTNMEIQEYVDDQFQDNPFIETTGEFEEQKQSEITKNNRADIDKSLDDNPYKQSQNENKLAQENQFETGEGYIPRSTVAKAAIPDPASKLKPETATLKPELTINESSQDAEPIPIVCADPTVVDDTTLISFSCPIVMPLIL